MQTITLRLAIPIFVGFWPMDIVFVPDLKWQFLGLRLCMVPWAFVVYCVFRYTRPPQWVAEALTCVFCFSCAAVILIMSQLTGGMQSPYFPALSMVALATVPFIPFRNLALLANIVSIYGPWVVFGLMQVHTADQVRFFVAHSSVMACTVIIALVLRSITGKIRQSEMRAVSKLGEVARQVAHDIRSPLTALKIGIEEIEEISPSNLTLIRTAMMRIEDIAGDLLGRHGKERGSSELADLIWMNPLLFRIVAEKQLEFRHRPEVKIEFVFQQNSYSAFVRGRPPEVLRAISNLINNAVEAIPGPGIVKLEVECISERVRVRVSDTGPGIPAAVLQQLGRPGFSHGKAQGHGLGLAQARSVAEALGGKIEILSTEGKGTTAIIDLPLQQRPDWFAGSVVVPKGYGVVVIDDDLLAHGAWAARFSELSNKVSLKHCESLEQLHSHVHDFGKQKQLFLIDHDFRRELATGLQAAEELKIQHVILVTNRFDDPSIQRSCQKQGIALLPKPMISYVPIVVE